MEADRTVLNELMDAAVTNPERARQMVSERPDLLTATTSVGETALHYLCIENHLEGARLLVALGADVNSHDEFGDTPLMSASSLGHLEVARFLLERGANVNARDNGEETALHKWVDSGHDGILTLLLAAGADIEARDSLGETPLARAVKRHAYSNQARLEAMMDGQGNGTSLGELLGEALPPEMQEMLAAATAAQEDPERYFHGVRHLASAGAAVDARDTISNSTPLMEAAFVADSAMIKLLLELGADVHAEDEEKATALHYAAEAGDVETIRLLIAAGADRAGLDSAGMAAGSKLPPNADEEAHKLLTV